MPNGICIYKAHKPSTHLCPIFRLGDIVHLAGGNFSKIAIKGGVISIQITWNCDLDWNFEKYCLPKYNFVGILTSITANILLCSTTRAQLTEWANRV